MNGTDSPTIVRPVDAYVGVVEVGSVESRAIHDGNLCVKNPHSKFQWVAQNALPKILRIGFSVQDYGTARTKHAVFVNAGLCRTGGDKKQIRGDA